MKCLPKNRLSKPYSQCKYIKSNFMVFQIHFFQTSFFNTFDLLTGLRYVAAALVTLRSITGQQDS